MTANQMNDTELAQRMGTDATDEEAAVFRSLLNDYRLGDTETGDISENEWLGVLSRV